MKKIITILSIVLVLLTGLTAQTKPDPYDILDKLEAAYDYSDQDYSATVTLIVEKPNTPADQMQFKLFQRDSKKQFTIVQLLPEADKGSGYLRDGDNMWFYDPIGRKFSHSSLKDAVGESDAKTSDIAKEYSYREDYNATAIESGKLGSFDVWIITLEAKTSNPAYAKDIYYVRKDVSVLLKQENYSANGRLMRTILMPKYTKMGNKFVPTQTIIRDELNKGEQTQQIVSEISASAIPDKVFTKAYLESLN